MGMEPSPFGTSGGFSDDQDGRELDAYPAADLRENRLGAAEVRLPILAHYKARIGASCHVQRGVTIGEASGNGSSVAMSGSIPMPWSSTSISAIARASLPKLLLPDRCPTIP
jgi:hypothetical protein